MALGRIETANVLKSRLKKNGKCPYFIFCFVFLCISALQAKPSFIPPLQGDFWLNSKPLTEKDLQGKVVLIDFWEYTCVNCLRTLPYLKEWHKRYHNQGLLIIGVHTPEFEFGKKVENVSRAVKELGISYPVVLDNEYRIWNAFRNQYWPRHFLYDARGKLRQDHVGEGEYAETEALIQKLLLSIHPNLKFEKPLQALTKEDTPGAVCYPMTPELYVGYRRGRLGNREGYQEGKIVEYQDPGTHEDGVVYANGAWENEPEALRHAQKTNRLRDYILIKYHAIEVNAVIKPEKEKNFPVYLFQDGKPLPREDRGADIRYDHQGRSFVLVKEARMYRLVNNRKYGTHELRLSAYSPSFALYSYTFGACSIPKQENSWNQNRDLPRYFPRKNSRS